MKNLFLFGIAAVVLLFSGCDDEIETSALSLDNAPTATLEVHAFAQLNIAALGMEKAPDGTKIMISIPNHDFKSGANGAYLDSARLNDGVVIFEIPTTNSGVSVNISGSDFTYSQVQGQGITKEVVFDTYTLNVNDVKPGEQRVAQMNYSSEDLGDQIDMSEVTFTNLEADLDDTNYYIMEDVEPGTSITFYTVDYDWSTTAAVSNDGSVTVQVPSNYSLKAYFVADKQFATYSEKYKFETRYAFSSYSTGSTLNFYDETVVQ